MMQFSGKVIRVVGRNRDTYVGLLWMFYDTAIGMCFYFAQSLDNFICSLFYNLL